MTVENDSELKNHVRVGVKAWDGAGPAVESGKWSASWGVAWVEVDGVPVPGIVERVRPILDEYGGVSFHSVDIRLIVGKFETVPIEDTTEHTP